MVWRIIKLVLVEGVYWEQDAGLWWGFFSNMILEADEEWGHDDTCYRVQRKLT